MRQLFNGIFEDSGKLLAAGSGRFFNEEIVRVGNAEYREWDPRRSKLAAAIVKGLRNVEIPADSKILYLGAAHGYTVSFLSQICSTGRIYAVEFAPRVARELVMLAGKRSNILPIIEDANQPNLYYHHLESVDIVYEDVAQRNQVEILVKNCNLFLKRGGLAMIAIKARSVDVAEKPAKIFAEAKRQLEEHFRIVDYRGLEPLQKDHAFFVCVKK